MADNWSGSPAGNIPLSKMTRLRSDIGPGGYAQPDAALAYLAMAPEFERAVGVPLKITEAYRDYATSVHLFVTRHTRVARRTGIFWDGSYWVLNPGQAPAGIPGTSFHLEGLAIDFAYPLTSWTTAGQKWFRANEARFGFSSAQGVADGEPWHKRFIGQTNTIAAHAATPITYKEDDDDMPKATYYAPTISSGSKAILAGQHAGPHGVNMAGVYASDNLGGSLHELSRREWEAIVAIGDSAGRVVGITGDDLELIAGANGLDGSTVYPPRS